MIEGVGWVTSALDTLFAASSDVLLETPGIAKQLEAAVHVLHMAGHLTTAEALLRLVEHAVESALDEPLAILRLLLALAGTASTPCDIGASSQAKHRAGLLPPSRDPVDHERTSPVRATANFPTQLTFSDSFYPSALVPLCWVGSELQPALRMCSHSQASFAPPLPLPNRALSLPFPRT